MCKSFHAIQQLTSWGTETITEDYLRSAACNTIPFVVCASAIFCPHSKIHTTSQIGKFSKFIIPIFIHNLGEEKRKERYQTKSSPHNKECIAIQMVALYICIIILKDDLHESFIRTINYRCIQFRRSFH